MTVHVDFFFSPASRYSYLAATQIEHLERDFACVVEWLPVHGPHIRELRGQDPFNGPAPSGQYEHDYCTRDAEAWASLYGVPFREPQEFEFDYELLVRSAAAGLHLGATPAFCIALASAVYGSGRWPVDETLVTEIADAHGLDLGDFAEELSSETLAGHLAETAYDAFSRGAFGVPTFFVGEQMFWGNDRLPLVRHAILEHGHTHHP